MQKMSAEETLSTIQDDSVAVVRTNYESQEEGHLTLKLGDKIRILNNETEIPGWWKGENQDGRVGLFCKTYVTVYKPCQNFASACLGQQRPFSDIFPGDRLPSGAGNSSQHFQGCSNKSQTRPSSLPVYLNPKSKKESLESKYPAPKLQDCEVARVMYDFKGNSEEEELTVKKGKFLEIRSKEFRDGWLVVAEHEGKVGLIPFNYVKVYVPEASAKCNIEGDDNTAVMIGSHSNVDLTVHNHVHYHCPHHTASGGKEDSSEQTDPESTGCSSKNCQAEQW